MAAPKRSPPDALDDARIGVRAQPNEPPGARAHANERLSARELEVLRLIALGHTSAEVARELQLSPRTIETHRAHINQKLRLATRAQLVRYALSRGMLG
ncbi:MAG TPA: LuxR C-terminal-related transcriptional regulator [Solirubrobacteraceae bacterium]|nr:LuxR C-terminal-related transcriptional regulator [Solirubrobacteraceae bacterium]